MKHTVVKTMRNETRKKGLRYHYGLDCDDDWPKGSNLRNQVGNIDEKHPRKPQPVGRIVARVRENE